MTTVFHTLPIVATMPALAPLPLPPSQPPSQDPGFNFPPPEDISTLFEIFPDTPTHHGMWEAPAGSQYMPEFSLSFLDHFVDHSSSHLMDTDTWNLTGAAQSVIPDVPPITSSANELDMQLESEEEAPKLISIDGTEGV